MSVYSVWRRRLLVILCSAIFLFLMLPLLIVFPLSVSSASFLQFPPPGFSWKWFEAFFGSASWLQAAALSLQVGASTAILTALLGVPVAFFITRARSRWLVTVVDKIVVTPMIIPPVVTAIAVYSLFSGWRWIGSWHALVLAHTILALPLMVIVVTSGLRQFDIGLEQAALGLGAGRLRAFFHVTLPLIRPSILTGLLFAFMTSFDDLIVALFLSGSNMTLPKKMFENIGYALDPTIAVVCVLQILLLVVIGGGWHVWMRRAGARGMAGRIAIPGALR